jgi:hypothetical protein
MNRWLTGAAIALASATVSCGSSPTEPTQPQPNRGLLVIRITQPCSLPGRVDVVLQGGPSMQVLMPGETRLSAPPGRYPFYFQRGNERFAGSGEAGFIAIVAGGTTILTDPLGACIASPQRP